ncbi:hypothetical protein PVAG01_01768 [Phlyctema vagabunda]|uniref:Uncharacterized protein n=1 Tax=Phlyctema vagabunda TaxID=108571 RepID=A0ABR4PYD0_9HELO
MSHFSQRAHDENMKIEHTTYEQVRPVTSRPRSGTRKVRDHFSSHSSSPNAQGNDSETIAPVIEWLKGLSSHEVTSRAAENSTTQQHNIQVQKMAGSDQERHQYPLQVPADIESKPLPRLPKLRRKGKFSDMVKEIGTKLSVDIRRPSQTDETHVSKVAEMHTNREAMKEGKLEQVAKRPSSGNRIAPTPPGKENYKPSHQRNKSSTSSKISEYIATGADVLDSTRREITKDLAEKFRPPFEHINYRPFSRNRESSISSDSSIFFCAGEEIDEPVTPLTQRQEKSKARRLSGDGTNPWEDPAPEFCKLCKRKGVQGVRGLCSNCEREFMRTYSTGFKHEPEIVPAPPLKDKEILKISIGNYLHEEDELGSRKAVQNMRLSCVSSKPVIVEPCPKRYSSQKATVIQMDHKDDDDKYLKWQDEATRSEFKESQQTFERWSQCYEHDTQDETPKPSTIVRREKSSKHDTLYGYWDGVLEDYGARRS